MDMNNFNPTFRSDSQEAFQEAIDKGDLSVTSGAHNYAGDYMYMYSLEGVDYFKHFNTKRYIKVSTG
jgi:uncharacterized protein YpmB